MDRQLAFAVRHAGVHAGFGGLSRKRSSSNSAESEEMADELGEGLRAPALGTLETAVGT